MRPLVKCGALAVALFWSVGLLLGVAAVSPSSGYAQSSSKSPASIKCHAQLAGLDGKKFADFSTKSEDELQTIRTSLNECVRESYSQLSRRDLAVAAVVIEWVQSLTDQLFMMRLQGERDELQEKYDDLLSKSAPKPSSNSTVTATIIPLPNGFTRTLSIGANQDVCSSVDAMKLECTKNVSDLGDVFDTYLTAMLVKVPRRYGTETLSGTETYLVGCNGFSSGCASLVPGDYQAEIVGDGLIISDLVSENKPDGPPVHGVYVIYGRLP